MRKRVLITGGAGYIGSVVARALLNEGHSVTVFDDLSTGLRESIDVRADFVEGDIQEENYLTKVCEGAAYDVVIHLAGKKLIEEGERKPDLYNAVNVEGTRSVLIAMARAQIPHIIFSSTAAVYGKGGDPYFEDMSVDPYNVYGKTKVDAEDLIRSFTQEKKIKSGTIFRYFNVAGKSSVRGKERLEGLLPWVRHAVQTGQPIRVFGNDYHTPDGTAVRDYIHVADIAHAHVCAINKGIDGIFNLGSGCGHSVVEVVDEFSSSLGYPLEVVFEERRAGDLAYSRADISKAKRELTWEPTYSLKDIIESLLDVGP